MVDVTRTISEAHGADTGAAAQALAAQDREMLCQMLFMAAIAEGEERASRIGMIAMAMNVIQNDATALVYAAKDVRRPDMIASAQARRDALEALREAIRIRYAGKEG